MKSEWVDIEGDNRGVGIDGKNFFTGEYSGPAGETHSVSNTRDQGQWERFWREGLGAEPPGPLPKGAYAIMLGENRPEAPTGFEVGSLKLNPNKDEIDVAWRHVWLANPDEKFAAGEKPKPRYAVLILPAYGNQTSSTVIASSERKQRADELAETVRDITEGTQTKVAVRRPLWFKDRATEFLRMFKQ